MLQHDCIVHVPGAKTLKCIVMIDLAFVRANQAFVEEKLRARGMDPAAALGDFADVDRERREAITQVETLKAQRNKLTEEIAKLRRDGTDTTAQTEQTKTLKSQVESLETAATLADEKLREILQALPNLPHTTVPIGKDEHGNREEKVWGERPTFDFAAKPHWELGEALGILDFNRAAKISGLASSSTSARARSWSVHSLTSCSICILANTAIPRFCRRTWSTRSRSSVPANCPSSPKTSFTATTKGATSLVSTRRAITG